MGEGDKVRLGLYMHWVKTELENESACLELPFTIILLISFSVLAYLHLQQAAVFNVEGLVKFDIEENANFAWTKNFGHKTVHDVNSIADFWSWFRIGFLPLMVQNSWGYSETMQAAYDSVKPANMDVPFDTSVLPGEWDLQDDDAVLPVRGDYLHYSRIIGGFRIRQQRSKLDWNLCNVPGNIPANLWKGWLGKPCVSINEDYELPPQAVAAESFDDPERVEWIMSSTNSLKQLQMKVVDMEDGCAQLASKKTKFPQGPGDDPLGGNGTCLCTTCDEGTGVVGPWLDEQTERVEIAYIQYNFEYGLYSAVTVNFFFNRGGMIHKLTHVRSVWADSFHGTFWELALMISCDCIWVFSLTYILIQEVKEVIRVVQVSKFQWYTSLYEDYLAFWNVVDWVSILVAYFVVLCWIRLYLAVFDLNAGFEDIAKIDTTFLTTSADRTSYEDQLGSFFDMMEACSGQEEIFRLSFMFYPMVVMLRLFKSFDAQPRLAVVTRTLVKATQDLVHFFIILVSCYLSLSVNAVLLFGKDNVDFSTWMRSSITSFRVLFGDWDYNKMREIGLLLCAIWFWVFMLLLFLLMLNILLAILMEAYAEVQASAEGDTLPTQISQIVRRYRQTQRGDRVRLNEVWKAYFKAIGDEKDMVQWEPGPGYPEGKGGRELITAEQIQALVLKEMNLNVPMTQAKRGINMARKVEEDMSAVDYALPDIFHDFSRINLLSRDSRDQVLKVVDILEQHDFDEDDMDLHRQVPSRPEDDCTETRQLVAETVKGAVGQLTTGISTALHKESTIFERRHKQLVQSQQEMVACARDACGNLSDLRDKTDDVVNGLQHQALAKQRAESVAVSSSIVGLLSSLRGKGSQDSEANVLSSA